MQEEKHKQRLSKRVQWDEDKLKETEKFRGQFQKIDQPKTPYRANQESDQQMQSEKTEEQLDLQASLTKARQNCTANNRKKVDIAQLNAQLKEEMDKYRINKGSSMEDEDEEAERKKRQDFKKKRAQHYNEFQMIQKMKQNDWQDDDEK